MNTFTNSDGRREAQAWVARQLAWEHLLSDIRDRAEDSGEPVAFTEPTTDAAAA